MGDIMNEVSIYEIKDKENIIDIRDNYSYNLGHLANAKNIPYYSLISNFSLYLNKNTVYYLYCDHGNQSKELSSRLNLFGYKTYYVKEGYLDFKNKIK